WALRRKRWVFIGVILLFVGTIALIGGGFIGGAFISQGDQGEMVVKLELDANASVYQTNMVTQQAEKMLMEQPEVTNVFSNIGYSSTGLGGTNNSNYAEINVKLTDKHERTITADEFGNKMQKMIAGIPGVKVSVGQVDITGNANQSPLMILVKGNN